MSNKEFEMNFENWDETENLKGGNFLTSAILMLRKQKSTLEREVNQLREKVALLEGQNAAFIDVSADRLLKKLG